MTPAAELFLWYSTIAEAKSRGKAHLAAAVYARRAGEPCPFSLPAEAPAAPMPDTVLHIDFETRSRVDLTESGQDPYACDPSTSILLVGYAVGDQAPEILRTLGVERPECPPAIKTHIELMLPVAAHNAAFEAALWRHVCVARWGWPAIADSMWHDTMALAAIRALPLSLAGCAAALGLAAQKSDQGRRIMLKWCKPRTPTKTDSSEWASDPLEYDALAEYCMQDVRVEREIHHAIGDAMRPDERAVWLASWRMNARGIPLDKAGAAAAQRIVGLAAADWAAKVETATGGALTAETMGSRKEVLLYLHGRGVHLEEWDSATVEQALARPMAEDARVVLQARQAVGRSSTAKAGAMLARVSPDGRIRDQFVYHGATTGRWTARGIQPQNLPRDQVQDVDACLADAATADLDTFRMLWGEPGDAIAGCIRGMIRAPEGHVLVAGDYAQIEARVLLWLADDPGLSLFGPGRDIYCEMASTIYGRPISKADKAERQLGKAVILGCVGAGTRVLTKRGGVDIARITTRDEVWNGAEWARFPRKVRRGRKVVMRSGRCALTPDHLVWTELGWQPFMATVISAHIWRPNAGRALASLRSLVPNIKLERNAALIADANAAPLCLFASISFIAEKLRPAVSARRRSLVRKGAALRGSSLSSQIRACAADGAPHISTSLNAVIDQAIQTTTTMGVAASATDLAMWIASSLISLRWSGGTCGGFSSTELMSTEITPRETYALSLLQPLWRTAEVRQTYDLADVPRTHAFSLSNGAMVHNCGFGMGHQKFYETCQRQGQHIDPDLAERAVKAYRERFVKVKRFWYACEDAAVQAVNDGDGKAPRKVGQIAYAMRGGDLRCRLPSGRLLNYPRPVLQDRPTPWGEMKQGIAYWSENQMTKQWSLGDTYGGKLVENATQAVARDLMAAALVRAEVAGWAPIMTVHDELVCVCPDPQPGQDLAKDLEAVMVEAPDWAAGIPLAAEAWAGKRYQK